MVVTEGGDGAVGGHQQRQHIEALDAVVAHQLRARSANINHLGGDFRALPGSAVHQWFAVRTKRPLMAQEPRMGAGGDHPTVSVFDVDDAVSFDAKRPEAYSLQLLTGHGLDRISPDLRDLHCHLYYCRVKNSNVLTAICAPLNNRPAILGNSSTKEVARADTSVRADRLALCLPTVADDPMALPLPDREVSDECWLQWMGQNLGFLSVQLLYGAVADPFAHKSIQTRLVGGAEWIRTGSTVSGLPDDN